MSGGPTPLPVQKLSAREICERALRKVGTFTLNDEGADEDQMEEALKWLDMILAEVTGTRRCYWLSPATITFAWPAATRTIVLADEMGADYPPTGILFPVRAWLVDANTGLRQDEIELCRRKKYEERSNQDTVGTPELLFIDRLTENQTASVWPVPQNAGEWQVALEVQTYQRSVIGEQGGEQAGDVPTGLDPTWQLFAVTRLAAEIGDGPVCRLETSTLRDWRTLAAGYLSDLLYTNREKNNRPYQSRRYGG